MGYGGVVQAPHLDPVLVGGHAVHGGGVHHLGHVGGLQQLLQPDQQQLASLTTAFQTNILYCIGTIRWHSVVTDNAAKTLTKFRIVMLQKG